MNTTTAPRRKCVLWRVRWVLLAIIIVLALVRLSLPFVVERYVNRQLNKSKDYSGRIGSVHIELWRGRYRINDVAIYKRTGGVEFPFSPPTKLYLSIEWKELFHGPWSAKSSW